MTYTNIKIEAGSLEEANCPTGFIALTVSAKVNYPHLFPVARFSWALHRILVDEQYDNSEDIKIGSIWYGNVAEVPETVYIISLPIFVRHNMTVQSLRDILRRLNPASDANCTFIKSTCWPLADIQAQVLNSLDHHKRIQIYTKHSFTDGDIRGIRALAGYETLILEVNFGGSIFMLSPEQIETVLTAFNASGDSLIVSCLANRNPFFVAYVKHHSTLHELICKLENFCYRSRIVTNVDSHATTFGNLNINMGQFVYSINTEFDRVHARSAVPMLLSRSSEVQERASSNVTQSPNSAESQARIRTLRGRILALPSRAEFDEERNELTSEFDEIQWSRYERRIQMQTGTSYLKKPSIEDFFATVTSSTQQDAARSFINADDNEFTATCIITLEDLDKNTKDIVVAFAQNDKFYFFQYNVTPHHAAAERGKPLYENSFEYIQKNPVNPENKYPILAVQHFSHLAECKAKLKHVVYSPAELAKAAIAKQAAVHRLTQP